MTEEIRSSWPRHSPLSLQEQIKLFLLKHLSWRIRSALPLPSHLLRFIEAISSSLQPLQHFRPHPEDSL